MREPQTTPKKNFWEHNRPKTVLFEIKNWNKVQDFPLHPEKVILKKGFTRMNIWDTQLLVPVFSEFSQNQ